MRFYPYSLAEEDIARKVSGEHYANSSELDSRPLGRIGIMPILALGGESVFSQGTEAEAEEVFRTAIESGVRYVDTAYTYAKSHERLGKFIKQARGVPLFVATKSRRRDRDGFLREVGESAEALGVVPDLVHVHAVSTGEQGSVLGRGGVLEAAQEARSRGMCRFIGATSHGAPGALWEVVRWADGLDVVMAALNVADTRFLPVARLCRGRGVGFVAMKVMGRGELVSPDGAVRTGTDALRFVLSCPGVSAAVVGFSRPDEVRELAAACEEFLPMTAGERRRMEDGEMPFAQDAWFYRDGLEGVMDFPTGREDRRR